jgi:uncharacterized protein (DUF934 family)
MTESAPARIWTRDGFVEDDLTVQSGAVHFSPEEATGKISTGGLNVLVLDAGDEAGAVAGRLGEIDAIFIRFPTFSDGRGFSTARLLREKYGYRRTIRAVGHFILDQIPHLLRVGVDQFAVVYQPTIERLARNELPSIPLYLQPAYGPEENAGERAWARRQG